MYILWFLGTFTTSYSQTTASMGEHYGCVFFHKYPVLLLAVFSGVCLRIRDLATDYSRYDRCCEGMQGQRENVFKPVSFDCTYA